MGSEESDIKPEDEDNKSEDDDIDGVDIKEEDIVPVPVKRRRKLKTDNCQTPK